MWQESMISKVRYLSNYFNYKYNYNLVTLNNPVKGKTLIIRIHTEESPSLEPFNLSLLRYFKWLYSRKAAVVLLCSPIQNIEVINL